MAALPDRSGAETVRPGRRRSTSRGELERAALGLFDHAGFNATTVTDIAHAAGIGRRTFFRYFESKNDVVWGSFSESLVQMRRQFAQVPEHEPLMDGLRWVVVEFNRFDPAQLPWHRRRMELILRVPALQAHSTLRYREWRAVVAEFVAERLSAAASDLVPQALAQAALGVALAAYEQWLDRPDRELILELDGALRALGSGFSGSGFSGGGVAGSGVAGSGVAGSGRAEPMISAVPDDRPSGSPRNRIPG